MKFKELEVKLQEAEGKDALICVSHKIFGMYKIRTMLHCICDRSRIRIILNKRKELYMCKSKIQHYDIGEHISIADELMQIKLRLYN